MANDSSDYARRLEHQYQRLDTRTPVCLACGEKDPFCLELHHLAAQERHEDVSIVCRNCHRKLTLPQDIRREQVQRSADSPIATLAHYLLGLCDLLAMVLQTLRDFALRLIDPSAVQAHGR